MKLALSILLIVAGIIVGMQSCAKVKNTDTDAQTDAGTAQTLTAQALLTHDEASIALPNTLTFSSSSLTTGQTDILQSYAYHPLAAGRVEIHSISTTNVNCDPTLDPPVYTLVWQRIGGDGVTPFETDPVDKDNPQHSFTANTLHRLDLSVKNAKSCATISAQFDAVYYNQPLAIPVPSPSP